ncbi:MAG: hypothetical protein U9Q70_06535 [Chloroflexota bacterium]|nr:hypothetical protein [Chloroflexota bacterium]
MAKKEKTIEIFGMEMSQNFAIAAVVLLLIILVARVLVWGGWTLDLMQDDDISKTPEITLTTEAESEAASTTDTEVESGEATTANTDEATEEATEEAVAQRATAQAGEKPVVATLSPWQAEAANQAGAFLGGLLHFCHGIDLGQTRALNDEQLNHYLLWELAEKPRPDEVVAEIQLTWPADTETPADFDSLANAAFMDDICAQYGDLISVADAEQLGSYTPAAADFLTGAARLVANAAGESAWEIRAALLQQQ